MEDGCSKRFDLGTMDLRAEGNGLGSGKRQHPGKASSVTPSQTSTSRAAAPAAMTNLPAESSLGGAAGASEPNGRWAAAR